MAEDGGDKGWGGDKGGDSAVGGSSDNMLSDAADLFGGGSDNDFSYAAPDFGNLDYLSSPGGFDSSSGGFNSSGYDNSILPDNASFTSGVTPWGDSLTPFAETSTVGQIPPGWPTPSGPATPTYEAPAPGQPGHAFSADAFTYSGPAGTQGTPDVAALNAVNPSSTASMANPAGLSPVGAGPGAGSDSLTGTGGGSPDLTSKKDSSSWTDSFSKNPLGLALAAGGLGYSMFQSKAMADALKGPTGQSPQVNLAQLAAPAAQTGRELTDEGRAIGRTGVEDLRARAATTDPNATTLIDRGTGLTGYVGTGKLPPEMQTLVDTAANDAKTARISFYASKGMPTDPTKNTALRTDLERIDTNKIIEGSKLAAQLAQTGTGIVDTGSRLNTVSGGFEKSAADIGQGFITSGISSSGLASNVYNNLAGIDEKQTERTQKAIAAMAAALSGQSVANAAGNVAKATT